MANFKQLSTLTRRRLLLLITLIFSVSIVTIITVSITKNLEEGVNIPNIPETGFLQNKNQELQEYNPNWVAPDKSHFHGTPSPLWASKYPGWTPAKKPNPTANKTLLHTGYAFNSGENSALPLDRPYRVINSECNCPETNLDVTVVIIFLDELFSALIRSVHSVLNRTPEKLLNRIILVDDCSDTSKRPDLGKRLEDYVANLPKTLLIRNSKREGLMHSRMRGAELALSETIMFLDSHIEVAPCYFQHLGAYLEKYPDRLVMPTIDAIESDTMEILNGGITIVGHTWALKQNPNVERKISTSKPAPSPIMAGGIFAVTREYWNRIDGYDRGLLQYAGEESEISFKSWLCGGGVYFIPCSRVAHIFRSRAYWSGSPFLKDHTVISRNLLRIVEVWLDQYKPLAKLSIEPIDDIGDLTDLFKLKSRLKCKTFDWYINNIYPELKVPPIHDGKYLVGFIRNPKTNHCIDTMQNNINENAGIFYCHNTRGSQSFLYTSDFAIRFAFFNFEIVLCYTGSHNPSDFETQNWSNAFKMRDQKQCEMGWEYKKEHFHVKNISQLKDYCLTISRKTPSMTSYQLKLVKCDNVEVYQEWSILDPKLTLEDIKKGLAVFESS